MPTDSNGRSNGVNRRNFLAGVGAGAVASSLAGCIGGLGGGGGPIKIGAVFLLSGIAESLGRSSQAGAKLGVKDVNDAGGIDGRDVEIIFRDHEADPATANKQFKSLVQEENVDAMIGLTSSGVTLATAPTVEQLGVPMILTDIGTPYITEFNYDKFGDFYNDDNGKAAGKKNIFRTNANTSTNTYAMAKFAKEKLDGIERVANIGPDYAYGHQCWEYFKAYSKGMGSNYEFVESTFPSLGASDMTPQINKVLDADPDLVFTSFWAGDAVTFVQQATAQGLFDKVSDVFDTLGADPTVFKALGSSMPEGYHYSSWYWHSAYDNQNNTSFLDAFKKQYEGDPDTVNIPSFTGPSTYSAIWLYKQAIEAADGSTKPDDVISQLEGMSYEKDPRGPITISADSHQANAPTVIGSTSTGDDVPYDGVGLKPSYSYSMDRSTAVDLLQGSGLPPGV